MLISSIVCSNHIALASILGKSIKKHMPECKFIVCLVEKELPSWLHNYHYFDELVLAKDLGFENFEHTIFKYSQYETSGACKGQLFKYMLQKYPNEDNFVYLDGDTQLFSPFVEVKEALKANPIVLTPHLIKAPKDMTWIESEVATMLTGIFNTGFLAIKRSKQANAFIDWWCDRLEKYCYTDMENGLYNEQKWLDLAPIYFQSYNLKHPGYNVANWNFFERDITFENGIYKVNGFPLRFLHYSRLHKMGSYLNKLNNETTIHGLNIIGKYEDLIYKHGHQQLKKLKWSYNYFDDGKKISYRTRTIFKNNLRAQTDIKNPFQERKRTFSKYRR